MRIGIITAMAQETMPILKKLGNVTAESKIRGVHVSEISLGDNIVYLATGGVGEICAAMTAQLLADIFDVEVLLNFGFVGSLNPHIAEGELVIVDKVCHYQFDTSAIDGTKVGQYYGNDDVFFMLDSSIIDATLAAVGKDIKRVAAASGDVFIASLEKKEKLHKEFGCDICDMELAGLAIASLRNHIPLLSVKVISDRADDKAATNFETVVQRGISKYEEILPSIIAAVSGKVAPLPPITQ